MVTKQFGGIGAIGPVNMLISITRIAYHYDVILFIFPNPNNYLVRLAVFGVGVTRSLQVKYASTVVLDTTSPSNALVHNQS